MQPDLYRAELRSRTRRHNETEAGRRASCSPVHPDDACTTRQSPGAATRALPRRNKTTAGSCVSSSPVPRRYHGWDQRFVLSHAATRQRPGGASSSPVPLRCKDWELRFVHSCASMIPRPGAALCALPRLNADERRAGSCDPCSPAPRRRCMHPQTYIAFDTIADLDLFLAQIVIWLRSRGARQSPTQARTRKDSVRRTF
jgi:hypothetical protein